MAEVYIAKLRFKSAPQQEVWALRKELAAACYHYTNAPIKFVPRLLFRLHLFATWSFKLTLYILMVCLQLPFKLAKLCESQKRSPLLSESENS